MDINEHLVPIEKAKIRKEEKFAEEFIKGFSVKYKVYRFKKLYSDYFVLVRTPENQNLKNIIIECKQFLWRKNFYQGILELLATDKVLKGENELWKGENELWLVCRKFYNYTYSHKKRYENATFLKILDLFKVKVVELPKSNKK